MLGKYKIAGHAFELNSIYGLVHERCAEYATEEEPEFTISITQQDIAFEKDEQDAELLKENRALMTFPEELYEFTAVYRKLCEKLFEDNILLFHGSVPSIDGEGYMFIAKSGTGKSTHARMWREFFGERVVMVNDDKPLVKIEDTGVTVYGTPWNGKHRLGNNISVPLKGICILKRGQENKIRRLDLWQAYPMLMQQIHRIPDEDKLRRTMALIDTLSRNVGLYEMECTISHEAAQMAYEFMK